MTAYLVGMLFGLGLLLMIAGLRPVRPSAHVVLSQLLLPENETACPTNRSSNLLRQVDERWGLRLVSLFHIDAARRSEVLQRDLRMCAMTVEQFAVDKALLTVLGVVLPFMVMLTLGSLGVVLPLTALVGVSLIVGVIGFVMPNLLLRSEAEAFRRDFRHGLSSLLELVSVGMAGGAQVQHAMSDAIRAGRPEIPSAEPGRKPGWVFEELGRPIDRAVRERQSPWLHLGELGRELGIPELNELTSSMTAAGAEGADVRSSLAARAQSLRARRIAEAEGEAAEISQRMAFPIALLAFGFLLFIGYPAVQRVFAGL